MPSSRRAFLASVAVLSVAGAGCNEESSGSIERTVTPVDVPRTDSEVLTEVATDSWPSIPSPVVVTEAHHEAALEHVETLQQSVAERVRTADEPVEFDDLVRVPHDPASLLEQVEERLVAAREAGPSETSIEEIRRALRRISVAEGYLRASAGELDADEMRSAIDSERAAAAELRDRVDYRIVDPARMLPTAYRAEGSLARLDGLRHAEVRLADLATDGNPATETEEYVDSAESRATDVDSEPSNDQLNSLLAEVYARVERNRRNREDAGWYLETATDSGTPSVRATLDERLLEVRSELADVADRFGSGDDARPERETLDDRFRAIRWDVGRRCERHLSNRPADPADGRLLREVVDGIDVAVEFRSIDVAVERTVDRLGGGEFPASALLAEKRHAVDAVEEAAEAAPIGRRFAATSADVLDTVGHYARPDRAEREGGGQTASNVGDTEERADTQTLARVHMLLVAAAEWAERGTALGESLSATLQAQQS